MESVQSIIETKKKEINYEYNKAKKELDQLVQSEKAMENIWKYPIEKIMPVLSNLITKVENQEYDWMHDIKQIRNAADRRYSDMIEVVLFFKKGLDWRQLKIENIGNLPNFKGRLSEFYEQITDDFIKIAYQRTGLSGKHPSYYYGLEDFDFYRPLNSVHYRVYYESVSTSEVSIVNQKYAYIWDFIEYCCLWQIKNNAFYYDKDGIQLYEAFDEIIPDFIRTRKKNN